MGFDNSAKAPFITCADDLNKIMAKKEAMIISGSPELKNHTPRAAKRTDKLGNTKNTHYFVNWQGGRY